MAGRYSPWRAECKKRPEGCPSSRIGKPEDYLGEAKALMENEEVERAYLGKDYREKREIIPNSRDLRRFYITQSPLQEPIKIFRWSMRQIFWPLDFGFGQ
jgi:hypothetical protein